MTSNSSALPIAMALATLAIGCTSAPTMTTADASTDASITYYRDIKPILEGRCTMCHQTGGIAPFALTSVDDVMPRAQMIRSAVSSRTMPPWPPASGCNQYVGDRSLTDAQIATISQWATEGAAAGDPAQTQPAIPQPGGGLVRVDREIAMPESYTPQAEPDEYRCFLIPWTDTATRFVTAFRALPGDGRIVHHAIAFIASPTDVPTYQSLDAQDATTGWPCYGGPGITTGRPTWLAAWVPGSTGNAFEPGTGIRIVPGSAIVLQVHYHTGGTGHYPDRTTVQLQLEDQVQHEGVVLPFTNPRWPMNHEMDIPAGQSDVVHEFQFDLGSALSAVSGGLLAAGSYQIHSVALHMHTLGTRTSLKVIRADSSETCLLDLPQWDFHWQGNYELTNAVTVNLGDQLAIECHWDNSQARQPVVNGQQQAPHDVNWGEGTADEMCLGMIYVTAP